MTRFLPLVLLLACQGDSLPAAARDHQARGDRALAAGELEAALVAYGHARELAPADPGLQEAVMRARVYLFAEDPLRITSPVEARYAVSVLLERKAVPDSVGKTALANLAFREGHPAEADKLFGEAIAADGKDRLPHRGLGMMLAARAEDASRARAELEQALAIRAHDPPATRSLAQLLLAQGEVSAAVAQLEKGLTAGEDPGTRLLLCRVREQQKDSAVTLACFRELTQRAPQVAEGWATYGQLLLAANEFGPAEKALRRAVELRPEPSVQAALGFALSRQKKDAEALPLFQSLLAEDPGAALPLFGAGSASESLGNVGLAREYYTRLLAVPASDGLVANLRSEAQNRLRALDSAAPVRR